GGPGAAGALTGDQAGDDADRAEMGGAPAADGTAEEDRSVAVALLLVEDPEPGEREELVDRLVGVRMVRRPREHRRHDELRVTFGEHRVVEPELPGAGRAAAVDHDAGRR